jgi:hypothetical protein
VPDLPDVSETFEVNVAPYVAGLQEAIAAAERFRDMNLEAAASIDALEAKMAGETAAAAANATANDAAANAALFLGTVNVEASENVERLAGRLNDQMDAADKAAAADEVLTSRLNDMRDAAIEADAAMSRLEYEFAKATAEAATAAVLMRPAMDEWRDSIAEASAVAEEAEVFIDGMADAIGKAGDDALTASAGVKTFVAAEAEAETEAVKLGLEQEIAAQAIEKTGDQAMVSAAKMSSSLALTNTATTVSSGFWARWGTVIHWVIAGGAELLAVTLPAAVAAGAAAFVLYQGAVEEVGERLTSMYGATEATAAMIHKTTGDVLGLGHAFQTAQNAANPIAYELLGAYVSAARSHMVDLAQAGLQVDRALGELSARIDVDLRTQGNALSGLLAHMVPDLIELGQVFGNLGHAILNFAADMPGLAEKLLALADGLSHVVLWLSELPRGLILGAMLLEEFGRWGGLATSMLGRLTGTVTESTGKWYSLFGNAEIVSQNFFRSVLTGLSNLTSGLGSAMMSAGEATTVWGANLRRAGESAVVMGEDGVLAAGETTVLQDALYTTGAAADVAGSDMIAAGAKASLMGARFEAMAAELTPLQAGLLGLAAAGFGYLVYKILTTKTATQEWTASLQKAVESASNVNAFAVIAGNMAKIANATKAADAQMANASVTTKAFTDALNVGQATSLLPFKGAIDDVADRTAGYSAELNHATTSSKAFDAATLLATAGSGFAVLGFNHLWDSFAGGVSKTDDLSAAMRQQQNDMRDLVAGGQSVSKAYGTNLAGAWALASEAGVNLSTTEVKLGKNANIAGQEIENLVAGYRAMDQVGGTLNNDMNALAAQAGLADTKVSGLNQAWDQFMQNATGLTSSFATLKTDIGEINNAVTTAGTKFDVFGGKAVSSTQEAAYALTSFSGVGAQVWQNYDAALQQAQSYTDSLRIAATTGAISQKAFTQQIAYSAQQLLPYARYSKAATSELSVLVQEAGGPATSNFKTLKDWIDQNTESAKRFDRQTVAETGAMSDATSVAEDYASTLNSQVAAALQSATVASSNLTGKAENLDNAWTNAAGHVNGQVRGAFAGLVASLTKVYGNTKTAEGIANAYARQLGLTSGQVHQLDLEVAGLITRLSELHSPPPITVTTNFVNTGSPSTAAGAGGIFPTPSGHAAAGTNYGGGPTLVGEFGPEVVNLPAGSSVLPSWQTAALAHGGGGGGSEGTIGLALHIPVSVGGQRVGSAVIRQSLTYQRRNPSNNLSLRTR